MELAVYLALTEELMGRKTAVSDGSKRIIARNRRATHDYHILDTWEAGMVLTGTEVKALRHGKASIKEAFARIRGAEVFLESMTITPYEHGNRYNHDPQRPRKLLLHRKEIARMIGAVERQGLTLIPLDLYFRDGHAKVTLALGKGKKQYDRRQDLKRRDAEREMSRMASRKYRA